MNTEHIHTAESGDQRSLLPAFVNDKVSWQARLFNRVLKHVIKGQLGSVADINQMRSYARRLEGALASSVKGVDITAQECGGVPCQRYDKAGSGQRVILYLHGGGFCLHLPKVYDGFAARLSRQLDAVVILPDYRLAPEHPFPAAVEDCFAVYQSLLDNGIKPENIIVMGDSAGGCLTLTTLMLARDFGLPLPAGAVALSPASQNLNADPQLLSKAAQDPMFSAGVLNRFKQLYLPHSSDLSSSLAFPVQGEFKNLPPIQFHVGSTEVLLDHTLNAAHKAQQSGVEVSLNVWDRMPHVHPLFHWLPESSQALKMIERFIDQHCSMADVITAGTASDSAVS